MNLQVMAARVDTLLLQHPQPTSLSGWNYPTLHAGQEPPINPMHILPNIGSIREDDSHSFNGSSTSQGHHQQGDQSTTSTLPYMLR